MDLRQEEAIRALENLRRVVIDTISDVRTHRDCSAVTDDWEWDNLREAADSAAVQLPLAMHLISLNGPEC